MIKAFIFGHFIIQNTIINTFAKVLTMENHPKLSFFIHSFYNNFQNESHSKLQVPDQERCMRIRSSANIQPTLHVHPESS